MVDVFDTDGIAALLALFTRRQTAPRREDDAEAPDPVLDVLEYELFDAPPRLPVASSFGPLPAGATQRRQRLVAAAHRLGVDVRRHPDRDELLAQGRVFFRGVSTGDPEYEDVSLTIALAKWLLFRRGIELSESRTVALAMRLWTRTGSAEKGRAWTC